MDKPINSLFFNAIGLRALSQKELKQLSISYRKDLINSLKVTNSSSIPMIPTQLTMGNTKNLVPGQKALIIGIGGTNIYAANVKINSKKKPELIKTRKKLVYYKNTLNRKKYDNPYHFFKEIESHIGFLLHDQIPDALAVIYSFPGTIDKTADGIDMYSSEKLPKGFHIPGISKIPLGKSLKSFLHVTYPGLRNVPVLVLNDTPAVILSCDNAKIGGVLGTGFNLAIALNNYIYNTESGNYSQIPLYKVIKAVDTESSNSGMGLTEKQVSGLYLGMTMTKIMHMISDINHSIPLEMKVFTSQDISDILQRTRSAKYTSDALIFEIARVLSERSAQIVGTIIGTIINTFPTEFKHKDICIPMEGSVFWGIPHFSSQVTKYAEDIASEKRISFIQNQYASIFGAAIAVLNFL